MIFFLKFRFPFCFSSIFYDFFFLFSFSVRLFSSPFLFLFFLWCCVPRSNVKQHAQVRTAISTCPVDCIHYVDWPELKDLEAEREGIEINFKAKLVGNDHDNARNGQQVTWRNKKMIDWRDGG